MKNVQTAIGFVSALLLANSGSAQSNIKIAWTSTAGNATGANGYLPKMASDGRVGLTTVIYQAGTADARFEYEGGEITEPAFYWASPSNISSPTQPGNEVGHSPSIAMVSCQIKACGGQPYYWANVIQVHQGSQDNGSALWYRTAVVAGGTAWAAAQQYDTGYNPTVAVDQWSNSYTSTTVVEVHQAGVDSSELWYHVGTLTYSASSVSVAWGPAYDTGFSGYSPTVSIANGAIVLVALGTAPELWYSTGSLNYNRINWGPKTNYDTGYNPTVSVQPCGSLYDCDSVLVEAHQGAKGTGLWYRIGTMFTGAITWTPNAATEYVSSGCYPSVSLLTNVPNPENSAADIVVETHSAKCGTTSNISYLWGPLQVVGQ